MCIGDQIACQFADEGVAALVEVTGVGSALDLGVDRGASSERSACSASSCASSLSNRGEWSLEATGELLLVELDMEMELAREALSA